VWSEREGGMVARRVSDWSRSGKSTGTGRDIVHHFYVKHPDGSVTLEGVRSAEKILGIRQARLRTIAENQRFAQGREQREEQELVHDFEKNRAAGSRQEAARIFLQRNPEREDWRRPGVLLSTPGVFLKKGERWTKAHPGHVAALIRAGWSKVED
jgi:hypothetical protein